MTRTYQIVVLVFFLCACRETQMIDNPWCFWKDYQGNPIIEPPDDLKIVADPTFLPPSQSPDGRWHLFAHTLTGIYHYSSSDGIHWSTSADPMLQGILLRPYAFQENGVTHLLYEHFLDFSHSQIEMRSSTDLVSWTDPIKLLEPTLAWEQSVQSVTGNPFLLKRDGEYWLYYSAGSVYLPDAMYSEPMYIGLARAKDLNGPYNKNPTPLIGPSDTDPYRNLGAGSMKLLLQRYDGKWIALNNGIYIDTHGSTRSAIRILSSQDGLAWSPLCETPILIPGSGWKRAFVYAFDVRPVNEWFLLYYNARDGWAIGIERIGLAFMRIPQ